ncbi:MAG TPA: 23S rRNA (uracil(1939)-C(5))-methyltransferase RlmD [Burkholderiaceae bacterium]|nr:23S rRNA (uracil(1939)-C(5))-methyltransferase RlmD [Burkholderiaceae bacterium]
MERVHDFEVESLDLEGRGVAHREGKVVFIEGALPRERVRAEITRAKPSYETARVVEVQRQSALRVTPRCPHFGLVPGACGGCSFQHLEPRAQLAVKQRVLEDALWHIGRVHPEVVLRPIQGPSWGYRHRARLAVRYVAKKGGTLVGFHERSSSYVADMRECHVLPPALSALLPELRALVDDLSIRQRLPQIEVAVGAGETGPRTVLVLRVLEPPSAADLDRLRAFQARFGIELWLQPGGPATAAPLSGTAQQLYLDLPEHDVRLPFLPTDFTQVNHRINEVLVRRVLRLLDPQPGERIVDCFCGLGNFTLPLARRAARVIGIDGSAELLRRAREAAALNGLAAQVEFRQSDLFAWTAADWDALGVVDAVLFDPPREGALAVARVLAGTRCSPRRLVYVSCNPATLARDCAVLVHEGQWRLQAAGVVNMFPHTSHVESIALLMPPAHPAV